MKEEIKYAISMWLFDVAFLIMPDNEFKIKLSEFIVNNLNIEK